MRISKLAKEYEISLSYTLFPLHPYVPDEGMSLEELFRGRGFDIAAAKQHLRELMEQEGLDYGDRSMTYNSRMAQELGKWASTKPLGNQIHNLLYRDYFVEGKNLAEIKHLVSTAEEIGLDGEEARNILEQRTFKDAVDADWEKCRNYGIMAVPTYLCADRKLVGAQTYAALEQMVLAQGAQKRAMDG